MAKIAGRGNLPLIDFGPDSRHLPSVAIVPSLGPGVQVPAVLFFSRSNPFPHSARLAGPNGQFQW